MEYSEIPDTEKIRIVADFILHVPPGMLKSQYTM